MDSGNEGFNNDLAQAYLTGELTSEEAAEFKDKLAKLPGFKKEMEAYMAIWTALVLDHVKTSIDDYYTAIKKIPNMSSDTQVWCATQMAEVSNYIMEKSLEV